MPEAPAAHLFRWPDITPEQLNPLLTRQFMAGEQSMIARILLTAGALVPEHSHPNEQTSLILSGALEFNFSGHLLVARAGEFVLIPGNVPHSARALEDTENIDFFAPPRQDWIRKDDSYLR